MGFYSFLLGGVFTILTEFGAWVLYLYSISEPIPTTKPTKPPDGSNLVHGGIVGKYANIEKTPEEKLKQRKDQIFCFKSRNCPLPSMMGMYRSDKCDWLRTHEDVAGWEGFELLQRANYHYNRVKASHPEMFGKNKFEYYVDNVDEYMAL